MFTNSGLYLIVFSFLYRKNLSMEAFGIVSSSAWKPGYFYTRSHRHGHRHRSMVKRSNNDSGNDIPGLEEVEELVKFSMKLADVAGHAIRPYWRLGGGMEVQQKKEEGRSLAQTVSPVTIADRAAERSMRDLIEKTYPTHGILGEEYGSLNLQADYVWVLDPIDGTKAFITGKPTFGTLIGLLYKGTPLLGIIDQPISNERWIGAPNRPTTFNGQPVSVTNNQQPDDAASMVSDLKEATVYTTTPDMFRVGEELEKFELVRDASLRTLYGCDCYAYALLASGWGVQVVIEADLGLYDYCAIVPIVQGAGGIITDWNNQNLTLSHHDASQGRILATSNTQLHQQIITLLSSHTQQKKNPTKETTKTRILCNYLITLLLGITIGANFPLRILS